MTSFIDPFISKANFYFQGEIEDFLIGCTPST